MALIVVPSPLVGEGIESVATSSVGRGGACVRQTLTHSSGECPAEKVARPTSAHSSSRAETRESPAAQLLNNKYSSPCIGAERA